uniref:Uncharacterized protein n=1 Tax=Globodera pallida TaxID=36090 RepID=A0A183C9K9_GLOPA
MDDLLTEINKNKHKQLDGQFIKQLVEKTRPLFISLGSNLLLILSKLQVLTTNPKIKAEVTIYDELATTQDSTFARWDSLKDQIENLLTYQNKRAKLLRKLQRSQGDDAIVEFDQKFVDELSNDLEEQRDLNLVVLTMFERNLKHLITHRENENQDQNHQRSMNILIQQNTMMAAHRTQTMTRVRKLGFSLTTALSAKHEGRGVADAGHLC